MSCACVLAASVAPCTGCCPRGMVWCIILAAACMSGQDAALAVFLSLLFSVQDFPISLKAFSVRSKVNSYSKSELS